MRRSWGLEILAFDLRITVQIGAGLAFNGYTFVFDIRGWDSAPPVASYGVVSLLHAFYACILHST